MPKLSLIPGETRLTSDFELRNVQMVAEGSPFADTYAPDDSKAFMEFDICHSIPDYLGPVAMGDGVSNFCGFFPPTLETSHESLRYQQLNLKHLLKRYSPPKGKPGQIPHDRIIGAIVATHMARKPMAGWRTPGNANGATACIKACAVVFKLAAGVDAMMGAHLSGKETQSVSIEVRTPLNNLGVYVPSRDEMVPLIEPTEDVFGAYKIVKGTRMPQVGKLKTDANPDGEQLLVVYGMGDPVHFAGVGVTSSPAERAAEIVRINAESGDMVGIAAESVFETLCGQKVTFSTGRVGEVRVVHTAKKAVRFPGCGWSRVPKEEDPVLEIVLPGGERVLRHYTELADRLE